MGINLPFAYKSVRTNGFANLESNETEILFPEVKLRFSFYSEQLIWYFNSQVTLDVRGSEFERV